MATKRILIVDDEETLTFSMYQSFIMEKGDYEVITAGSGEEALEKLNGKKFHFAIVDIYLPGMNGFELIKKIKERDPHTIVMVITAYGSSEKKKEAMDSGALYFFEKPFNIREIKGIVLKALSS